MPYVLESELEAPAVPPRRKGVTFVTRFTPGANHNHLPTGRWADVQADASGRCNALRRRAAANPRGIPGIAEALAVECACATLSPAGVAALNRDTFMLVLPLARRHLVHYLAGSGANVKVDLEDVIRRDSNVRAKLAAHIRRSPRGQFRVEQHDYDVKDFQFAFGAIDRLDFQVDRAAGLVHIWFQDRYEWHPVGFGYKPLPGDGRRPSNCVHAAMVELKISGAKDYWMIGEAVIPLSLVTGGSPSPSGPARPMGLDRFGLDSPALTRYHTRLVDSIAQRIAASWNTSTPISVVHLTGHTDSRGPADYNHNLGLRRTETVRSALVQSLEKARPGVSRAVKLLTVSRGATQPVAVSRTPAAMARNRRVTVSLNPGPALPAGQAESLGEHEVSLETPGMAPGTSVSPPPLLYSETTVPGETQYVNITLGEESPAQPMTGIFIPTGYRNPSQVDLILYLHGHHKRPPRFPLNLSIDDLWLGSRFPFWKFREGVNSSNRNAILVAPTLGPGSESGRLVTPGGLAWYLDQVLAALRAYGPFKGANDPPPLGNLVLACHSGGGERMRQIASTPQKYADKITECWGFDCLYHDIDLTAWVAWARANPDKRLFIHFGDGGTAERSRRLQASARGLSNVSVDGAESLEHNKVPITHWQKRLRAARFLLER